MKQHNVLTLSIAAVSGLLLVPPIASAQADQSAKSGQAYASPNASMGSDEATQMVKAQAALERTIDARKATPGQAFEVKLAGKVRLKNGPELPNGTLLMGHVATDDMQVNGMSKLALCIDKAQLKDGQVIPIKATIVGVFAPGSGPATPYPTIPGDQVQVSWNDRTLQVDQPNVIKDVDLHSKIASQNSGVLVSTKKDDVKLTRGTEFGLAIAEQGNGQQSLNGRSGS